MAVVNVIAAS